MSTHAFRRFLVVVSFIVLGSSGLLNAQINFKGERPPNPPVYLGQTQPRQRSPRFALRQKMENAIERGNVAREAEQYTTAEAEYRRALRIDPKEERAFQGLGNVASDLGHYDDAVQSYQTAIRFRSTDAKLYASLAAAYMQLGKVDEAEEAVKRALQLDPKLASAHFWLGVIIYQDKNRSAEAIEHLLTATRLNPNYIMAHLVLGCAYVQAGNKNEAVEQQQELERLGPTATNRDSVFTTWGLFELRRKIKEMP